MGAINHPSFGRLYSAFKAHDHIYFVMDIVNGIDFYYCVQQYEISEVVARFYMSQVGGLVSLSSSVSSSSVCMCIHPKCK